MEENIRWAAFKRLAGMHTQLKKLLASPSGALLKESAAVTTDYDGESLSAKLLKGRIDGFKCAPQLHNVPHILPLTLPISSHTSPYPSDHHQPPHHHYNRYSSSQELGKACRRIAAACSDELGAISGVVEYVESNPVEAEVVVHDPEKEREG